MKRTFLVTLILGFASTIFAGPISSGGGDAKVAEFLNIADEVCSWSLRHPLDANYAAMKLCSSVIQGLKASLDQSDKPKIAFTDQPLLDNGVAKVALFNRTNGSIIVNRDLWEKSSNIEKYITVSIEISGLCGVEKRYEFGQMIAANFKTLFSANAMTCEIKVLDPKTGISNQLLPPTTKPIDLLYDRDFKTTLTDTNNKRWNIWLLESAPSPNGSEIELSWSIRDSLGESSELENVSMGLPFVNGAEASLKVLFNGLVISGHCELQAKNNDFIMHLLEK